MEIKKTDIIKTLDFLSSDKLEKLLVLDVGLIYFPYSPVQIAERINYFYKQENKEKIIFSDYYEAPNTKYLVLMKLIIDILINEFGYTNSNFIFLSGCFPTQQNFNKLKELFLKEKLPDIKIVLYPYFQNEWANILNTTNLNLQSLHQKNLRPYHSLYFTGALRPHRLYILYKLILHGYAKKCKFSILSDNKEIKECLLCFSERYKNDFILQQSNDIINTILNYSSEFPIILSAKKGHHQAQHELSQLDIDLFSETYYSIIGETSFFKNDEFKEEKYPNWNFHLDYTFITEKTFRAIACLHPFVLMSRPYTLSSLRELGYRTFSPYIDESYDEIEDDDARIVKIFETISKLESKTDKEWIKFQNDIYPVVLHNHNLLRSTFKYADKYLNARDYYDIRGQEQS